MPLEFGLGREGLVVSVDAFYSDDPSSNLIEFKIIFYRIHRTT